MSRSTADRPAAPRFALAAVVLGLLMGIVGCAGTRQAVLQDQITDAPADRPILVYTLDDHEYRLRQHAVVGKAIHGTGTVRWQGRTLPFEGAIPLESVVAVGSGSRSGIARLVAVGATALFVVALAEGVGGKRHATAREDSTTHFPSSGGGDFGTSCPYVYAWNGTRYELQAEPFGTAWGRALEVTTRHLLPAARADHGAVRLRLTDERREIHYVNSIQLRAIDLGNAPAAVLDVEGTAWPLSHPEPAQIARDREGRDILSAVSAADGRFWERDLASLTPTSGYEDVIEVAFRRPPRASEGSLVVTAVNTELSSVMVDQLNRLVGDRGPALAHAVETNAALIDELKGYLADASLAVSVWNGRAWEPAGSFPPEANAVTFARAMRLHVPKAAGDTVRVRLHGMADVWRIDAIAADWSEARPLPWQPIALRSATGPDGDDLGPELAADDDRRAILLPGDRVELTFVAPPARPGGRTAYAVAARGYLHEWSPDMMDAEPAATPMGESTEQQIARVVELLRDRNLALPAVYEQWRRERVR